MPLLLPHRFLLGRHPVFGGADSFSEDVDDPPEIFGDNLKAWVETKGGESNVDKDGNDRVATWFARSASHGPDLVQATANNKPMWEAGHFKSNRAAVFFSVDYIGGTSTDVHMDHTEFSMPGGNTPDDMLFAWVSLIPPGVSSNPLNAAIVSRSSDNQDWVMGVSADGDVGYIQINENADGNAIITTQDIPGTAAEWKQPNIWIVVGYKSTLGGSRWYRGYQAGPGNGYTLTEYTKTPIHFTNEIPGYKQNAVGNPITDSGDMGLGALAIVHYPHPGGGPGVLADQLGDNLENFDHPSSPIFKVFRYLRNNYVPRNLL